MPTPSLYEVLEVSQRASPTVIQAAYRALLQQHHPDHGGSAERTSEIVAAYQQLSDPDKRKQYDASLSPLGTIVGDRYQVLQRIAEGSFGITYLGKHTLTEEPVCLKQCGRTSPQYEKILLEEAQLMWDLRHFSIPAVRDLIRLPDGSLALVMSYIPGLTLEQVVKQNGRMDPEHVAWILERALNALKYLHYHGVIHGDIKPQNTILQKDHSLVLVDYGLAMVKPTLTDVSKGYTPFYASPEEARGERITPESDLYSLGMTAVYALCGGDLQLAQNRKVPDSTPEPLCHLLQRFTQPDPDQRPHWDKEDLCDSIVEVRRQAFGRRRSGMKPIPGLT